MHQNKLGYLKRKSHKNMFGIQESGCIRNTVLYRNERLVLVYIQTYPTIHIKLEISEHNFRFRLEKLFDSVLKTAKSD